MHIKIKLIGCSHLDTSKMQILDFKIPLALGNWQAATLPNDPAVYQKFTGVVYTEITEDSSPSLKRLLREGNKIAVEVEVFCNFVMETGAWKTHIPVQRVVGIVKPASHHDTSAWHAYSYKQPTKRLLRRLKGNFIRGYSCVVIALKWEKQQFQSEA